MGRRIAVTSSIRRAAAAQPSALVRVIDLDTGQTVMRSPLPESPHRVDDPTRGVACAAPEDWASSGTASWWLTPIACSYSTAGGDW
jgi:hypothetical protein